MERTRWKQTVFYPGTCDVEAHSNPIQLGSFSRTADLSSLEFTLF